MDVAGDLKLWSLSPDGSFILKASLLFGRNLQETTALGCIGEEQIMLLTGGYDSKIHVYTIGRKADDKLAYQFSMLGHFNSVKDLAFSPVLAG